MIGIRKETVAHTFLPSLDNANDRLCNDRSLRSRHFATMVTWRHTSSVTLTLWALHIFVSFNLVSFSTLKPISSTLKLWGAYLFMGYSSIKDWTVVTAVFLRGLLLLPGLLSTNSNWLVTYSFPLSLRTSFPWVKLSTALFELTFSRRYRLE